jgi:hypothetical protein
MKEKRNAYIILVGKQEERDYFESLGVDWRQKYDGVVGFVYLTQNEDKWQGFCAHGNETSDSIKCLEFASEERLYCLKLV